jgi:hypothetical protein
LIFCGRSNDKNVCDPERFRPLRIGLGSPQRSHRFFPEYRTRAARLGFGSWLPARSANQSVLLDAAHSFGRVAHARVRAAKVTETGARIARTRQ